MFFWRRNKNPEPPKSEPAIAPLNGDESSDAQRWRLTDLEKSRSERENGGEASLPVLGNGDIPSPTILARNNGEMQTPANTLARRNGSELHIPARSRGYGNGELPELMTTPTTMVVRENVEVVTENVDALDTSPVEVAIAFMRGRGITSLEPLHQRDVNVVSTAPSSPQPPLGLPPSSVAKWSVPSVRGDMFATPLRPLPLVSSVGMSRTVARTPYSRPQRLFQPRREGAVDGTFGTPSVTRWTPIRTPVVGGREMLKRRSTAVDEGWMSADSGRRTRLKTGDVGFATTPSATRWTPIRAPVSVGREMLKRRRTDLDDAVTPIPGSILGGREGLKRSTDLEDELTSGGPIRRTRQRTSVYGTPSSLIQARTGAMTPISGSSLLSLPSPGATGRNVGVPVTRERNVLSLSRNFDVPAPSTSRNVGLSYTRERNVLSLSGNGYVPAQSSATARKILETLEKMTPSPNGRALSNELAIVRDRPPTILTEDMLNERARKTMTVVDHSLPRGLLEPGPSSRILGAGSPSSGYKSTESSLKVKGKEKASGVVLENGPLGSDVLQQSPQERRMTAESTKQKTPGAKETASVSISESDRAKGFRMSAIFEESGSEDESLLVNTSLSTSSTSSLAFPKKVSKSPTGTNSLFGTAGSLSLPPSAGAALFGVPATAPSADTSKLVTPGFSFPTRGLMDGPPTPKAMPPASTSPKGPTTTPFFQFAQRSEPPAGLGLVAEQSSIAAKAGSQVEFKAESLTSSPSPSSAQSMSKLESTNDPKPSNVLKPSFPSFGTPSSAAAPAMLSTVTSVESTSTSLAGSGPASTLFKFGDTFSASPTVDPFKAGSAVSNVPTLQASPPLSGSGLSSAPFKFGNTPSTTPSVNPLGVGLAVANVAPPLGSSSSSLFGSGTSAPFGAGKTSSVNLFDPAPVATSFVSKSDSVTLSPLPPGSSVFGQLQGFTTKSTSTTSQSVASPDTQTGVGSDSSTKLFNSERPQKRSNSTFQDESSKRSQPPVTMSTHSFTTFGSTIGNAGATTGTLVTSTSTTTSQTAFPVSSFGQGSSLSQVSSALPTTPGLFTFGTPASNSGGAASIPSSTFSSAPAFPPFAGSVFGAASSGSTFGSTSAMPMTFSTPAFGTANANTSFGGFGAVSVSQAPTTAMFGVASTSSAPSATPAFGTANANTGFGGFGALPVSQAPTTAIFGPSTSPAPSTTPAFGAASSNTGFGGGFGAEAVSQSPATPIFGAATSTPSTTPAFAYGATGSPFSFTANSASSSGPAFSFNASSAFPFAANKTAPTPSQPSLFGLSNPGTTFDSSADGAMVNDVVVHEQSNMDDNSMAEEPQQIVGSGLPQPSLFGAPQSAAGAGSFVFGAQTGAGGATGPSPFTGYPQTNAAVFGAVANPYAAPLQPSGSLDFSGGSFNFGSGGDRTGRKFIKAKRTGAKRGK